MKPLLKPAGIVIHHSLTKDGSAVDWDAIRRYHMKEKGWDDIGYHAGIERIGTTITTMTGRPVNREGAHTIGHNDMLGLCIVGNFDLAPPDAELLQAAAGLVRSWLRMYPHLTPLDIHCHSEYAAKSCPGSKFPWQLFLAICNES